MAIKVMADSGGTITYSAAEVGAAWNSFAGGSDYVIGDIGEEMSVTTSTSSLEATVKSGRAVLNGRLIEVTSNTSVNVPASVSNYYLVLRVDLSQPLGSEGSITYLTGSSQVKTENLNNGSSGKHDLILGTFTSGASGIKSFTDLRSVINPTGGMSKIRVIHDQNGNVLSDPLVFEIVKVV